MRKLNVYDDIDVTSPLDRLKGVKKAEVVLTENFEEAKKLEILSVPTYKTVRKILEKRRLELAQYREQLTSEMSGIIVRDHGVSAAVQFKDEEVEQAIREHLGLESGPITISQMSLVKELCIEGAKSLEGLQYAYNLESLALTWTDIFLDRESDRESGIIFSALRDSLKTLYIGNAVFNEYTSLTTLRNLEELFMLTNYVNELDFSTFCLLTSVDRIVLSKNLVSEEIQKAIERHPKLHEHVKIV